MVNRRRDGMWERENKAATNLPHAWFHNDHLRTTMWLNCEIAFIDLHRALRKIFLRFSWTWMFPRLRSSWNEPCSDRRLFVERTLPSRSRQQGRLCKQRQTSWCFYSSVVCSENYNDVMFQKNVEEAVFLLPWTCRTTRCNTYRWRMHDD